MRVIAGQARGRLLRAPRSERIRPTSDKVKGAIFSMLEAEAYKRGYGPDDEREFAAAAAWARVLELYAGSGSLAIEAISRGAESADLVEPDGEARRVIEENLRRTGLAHRARVHPQRAEQALERLAGPYDLVLLDPPYQDPGVLHLLRRLAGSSLLGTDSVIVLEHPCATQPPARLEGFTLARTKRHGATCISLFSRDPGMSVPQ